MNKEEYLNKQYNYIIIRKNAFIYNFEICFNAKKGKGEYVVSTISNNALISDQMHKMLIHNAFERFYIKEFEIYIPGIPKTSAIYVDKTILTLVNKIPKYFDITEDELKTVLQFIKIK